MPSEMIKRVIGDGLQKVRDQSVGDPTPHGSIAREVLLFWIPLGLLVTFLFWQLLTRFTELPHWLREGSYDLWVYRQAGEGLLRGDIPYRDFFVEYPPGSLLAFVPPALLSNDKIGYIRLFSWEMALMLVAALVLTVLTARRFGGFWAWIVPAVTFSAAAIMLYPIALNRYDAFVALTLAIAALCATPGGGHITFAYASLGLGTAAKLVPSLATLPLTVLRRGARRGYAIFFAVVGIFFIPALVLAGGSFAESFAFHARRGLQVESLAASVLMNLGLVNEVVAGTGALEVRGPGVELASSLSFLVTGALLLITAFFMYLGYRSGRLRGKAFPRYAAALILAFMLGSKVLSPQYMLWLLPLVPLVGRGLVRIGVSVVFLAACWMTTQVFPIHYGALLNLQAPGPILLLARNLLLALLWSLFLLMPGGVPNDEVL